MRSRCRGELDTFKVTLEEWLVVLVGGREEVTEECLRLPFGSILELNPDVHTARARKCGIQALKVVRGSVNPLSRVHTKADDQDLREKDTAFCSGNAIQGVEKTTQTQCVDIRDVILVTSVTTA